MKVAITSQNQRTVSGHAGRTTRFVVFELEGGKVLNKSIIEVDKENTLHEFFHTPQPAGKTHPILEMDVVITGSMGPGFPVKMKMNGIEAIMTDEGDIEVALQKYVEGTLKQLQPDGHC